MNQMLLLHLTPSPSLPTHTHTCCGAIKAVSNAWMSIRLCVFRFFCFTPTVFDTLWMRKEDSSDLTDWSPYCLNDDGLHQGFIMCFSFNKQMCIQLVTQLVGSSRLLTCSFWEQLYRPNKHIDSLHNTSRSCTAERHTMIADAGLSPPAMALCLFVAALLHSVSSVCCHVAVCVWRAV